MFITVALISAKVCLEVCLEEQEDTTCAEIRADTYLIA